MRLARGSLVPALGLFAAGAALPLAFAPAEWWPLAPISLAVLFYYVVERTARASFGYAFSFGVGMFAVGVGWINESFQYSNVHGPVVWVLTLIFVVFLAVFPALAVGLAQTCRSVSSSVRLVCVLPAAWILVEWMRGWLLTGFTWLQLGYTQSEAAGAGLAPLLGSYGVGLLVVVSAGVMAALVRASTRTRWTYVGGVAVVAVWVGAMMLRGSAWTEPDGEPIRVALVQGNYAQDLKWKPNNRAPTLARYRSLTRRALADGARLVIWPETAIPAFAHQIKSYQDQLHADLAQYDATLLFGLPYLDKGREIRNTVIALGNGDGVYHKRHLVPFGEYVPLAPIVTPLMKVMGIPVPGFTPALDRLPLIVHDDVSLGITICYEAAFGSEVALALPEAQVLVNVSNDAWFGDSLAPPQHLQIAQLRALETGRPMLRATNTGISAIISPTGLIEARSPAFAVHVLHATVQPMQGVTPYLRFGDWPVVGLVLIAVGLAMWRSRRPLVSA